MNIYLKVAAGVLITLVFGLSLNKNAKDLSILLTITVCVMTIIAAVSFLQPVIDFVKKLQTVGELDGDLLSIILKAVGIGLITEISVLICKDGGNESTGKALQLFSTVVILWMSIPVFEKLLSLLDNILGNV